MSAKALNKDEVMKVRTLIHNWTGAKFTWNALLEAIFNDLGIKVTKTTIINTYPSIYSDFRFKKNQIRGVIIADDSSITSKDINEVKKLREELTRCRAERDIYKSDYELAQEMIERVIVNASSFPNLNVSCLFEEVD